VPNFSPPVLGGVISKFMRYARLIPFPFPFRQKPRQGSSAGGRMVNDAKPHRKTLQSGHARARGV
jgi:hypothetical protein